MSQRCSTIERNEDIVGLVSEKQEVYRECLRFEGHKGPHLIKRASKDIFGDGMYTLFQYDLCEGDEYESCYGCQSEDPTNWCQVYQIIEKETAEQYIDDPFLVE